VSALETPEEVAEAIRGDLDNAGGLRSIAVQQRVDAVVRAIRARDAQVAAWCEARAAWLVDAVAADELRAIAATLRGAR
jgi:hypothetical protein